MIGNMALENIDFQLRGIIPGAQSLPVVTGPLNWIIPFSSTESEEEMEPVDSVLYLFHFWRE